MVLTLRHRPRLIHHNSAFGGGTFVRDALLYLVARLAANASADQEFTAATPSRSGRCRECTAFAGT